MTRQHGRFRAVGLVVGSLAGTAMIVVGCQSLTGGSASVDPQDAAGYRASVATSAAQSASRSSEQESSRQASMTTRAVHTACEALSITSVNAIDAVNAFVFAFNRNEPGQEEKSSAAVDSLNATADAVSASLSEPLSNELEGLMVEWSEATRAVAGIISQGFDLDQFNAAVDHMNDVNVRTLALCDAAYR